MYVSSNSPSCQAPRIGEDFPVAIQSLLLLAFVYIHIYIACTSVGSENSRRMDMDIHGHR